MIQKGTYIKHLEYGVVLSGIPLFLSIIIGIVFSTTGTDLNVLLVLFALTTLPIFLFVVGYYGIKRKVTFSPKIWVEVILFIIFVNVIIILIRNISTSLFLGMILVGGFLVGTIIKKIQTWLSDTSSEKFAKIVGLISTTIGIFLSISLILFSFYLYFIMPQY